MRTESYAMKNKEEIHAADKEQWLGNWIWHAVHALVESPEFNPSPKWIGRRLNISVEKAVEALEGLERLGYIQRDNNSFKVSDPWFQVAATEQNARDVYHSHSKIAVQILNKLKIDDLYSTQFFIGSKELVKKYVPKFIQLYKEMNDEALSLGLTEVMASQICFTKVSADEIIAEAGGRSEK